MYLEFYGLRERPFALSPDPRFLLLTPKHREALSHLRYALAGHTSLALLVGEAGTGKTTLLRAALEEPRGDGRSAVVLDNPTLTRDELFEFLADAFDLGHGAGGSKVRVLRELKRVLAERPAGASALIVDEAQSLSHELLEEVRLLANLDTGKGAPLSIVLAGHPELAERLHEPELRQLKQRIELRAVLEPLTLPETAEYIAGRLGIAGGSAALTFTRGAVQAVFASSGGIPRAISVICENALVAGFAVSARPVDRDVVSEVCRDLDLRASGDAFPEDEPGEGESPAPPAPAPPAEVAMPAPSSPVAAVPAPQSPVVAAPAPPPPVAAPRPPRRVFDLLPFWKRREPGPLRLRAEPFAVDGQQGLLITPATDEGPAVAARLRTDAR